MCNGVMIEGIVIDLFWVELGYNVVLKLVNSNVLIEDAVAMHNAVFCIACRFVMFVEGKL